MAATMTQTVAHSPHCPEGAIPTQTRMRANEIGAIKGARTSQRPRRHPIPPAAKINQSIGLSYPRFETGGCTQDFGQLRLLLLQLLYAGLIQGRMIAARPLIVLVCEGWTSALHWDGSQAVRAGKVCPVTDCVLACCPRWLWITRE